MKTHQLATLATLAFAGAAFAGDQIAYSSKQTMAPASQCFADREWQLDLFGAYAFTSSNQDRLLGDHAWGGGLGVNYFFMRNIGVGIEGSLYDSQRSSDVLGHAALNVFVRFPMDAICLSPYLYSGIGGVFNAERLDVGDLPGGDDSDNDALLAGHIGAGVEYRIAPNFGVFVDGRFTVVDEKKNNFTTIRTGFRIAF